MKTDTKEGLKKLKKLVEERIEFYKGISEEDSVQVKKFEILQHPLFVGTYFVHIDYSMNANGEWLIFSELELWTKDAGWLAISRQMNAIQLKGFLEDCKETTFDTKSIKIKE